MKPSTVSPERKRVARQQAPRRSGVEIERLLLHAAAEAFAHAGFGGATTRRVATDAGVNETLIFRYFGSKAGLYRAAVLEPAAVLIAAIRWPEHLAPPSPLILDRAESWIKHVDSALELHTNVLVALLNHGLPLGDDGAELECLAHAVRDDLFVCLEEGAESAVGHEGSSTNLPLAVRATFALLVGVQVYGSTLFGLPAGSAAVYERRREIVQLAALTLIGEVAMSRQSPTPEHLGPSLGS